MSDLDGKTWDLDSVDVARIISEVLDTCPGERDEWEIETRLRTMVGTRIEAWPNLNRRQWREAYDFLIATGAATRRVVGHVERYAATPKPRALVGSFIGVRGLLRGAS